MTKFVLFRYNGTGDEEKCFEHPNIEVVSKYAIQDSLHNENYTYRMERWNGGRLLYDFRFFHKGKEITIDIIDALFNQGDSTYDEVW